MKRSVYFNSAAAGLMLGIATSAASAAQFDIPAGTLESALTAYMRQTGVQLLVSEDAVKGARTRGVRGDLTSEQALDRILSGSGFSARHDSSGITGIVRDRSSSDSIVVPSLQIAQATPARAAVETVTVTSSKLGGADVQSIPIAITALSQEQLTSTQTAGGPDLVKQVPNLTFSKTNFTGYNIQIRGIGTQAISVTTDPAVAVAFNDVPFIRNHFFEQEFYDVSQVEVLRGPQGTLYGRNATAGVVNVTSAKPSDQFEAMASADIGNYKNRRFEGMINLPIVDDRVDLRVAGEWTKRNGYSFNEITNQSIDGRDLWSSRVTLSFKPSESMRTYLVWEHFQEDDDRMRTAKQLCKTDVSPDYVDGVQVPPPGAGSALNGVLMLGKNYLSQGCIPTSLYSPDAFEVPYGYSLPYAVAGGLTGLTQGIDPYASTVQSHDLRNIESTIDPRYKARNDTLELNVDYDLTPSLTLTAQTGINQDFLWSTEDYNRFNTSPGFFRHSTLNARAASTVSPDGYFCDPQLGCTNRLVAQDLSEEHAWQASQEVRLASHSKGPVNFSFGGNFLHYETEENYYVFINALTLYAFGFGAGGNTRAWQAGVTDNHECLATGGIGSAFPDPLNPGSGGNVQGGCAYIDPNPIGHLNNAGHNYFLSQNPYVLNSYALFGESYYDVTPTLKLTGGLRWTKDEKHFVDIPSEVVTRGYGYPSIGSVDQSWSEPTGRVAVNWSPKLDFADQTLVYGSYAHGYKAGGANPPGAALPIEFSGSGEVGIPTHPLIFKPEFINAYELGSKNTLADGSVTLNGSVFYYNYEGYQISQIVDRTSVNLNFDATVKGAELESSWEPLPGLKFNFAGGYEATRIKDGQSAIDLMDRTAGMPGWMVVKPFPTQASNCILPTYVIAGVIQSIYNYVGDEAAQNAALTCAHAYSQHVDPVTLLSYKECPTEQFGNDAYENTDCQYRGFDPASAPNNGEGFAKPLGGNELPNAPHFTLSLSGEYTIPVSEDWAATLHSDFYWQSQSWARVFNDNPYDRIHGYTTTNLAVILTNTSGWQVMGYVKNVFDKTAITGDFLNSDDSGLTTNVFLTDPRLFGVRVTKNW